MKEISGGYLNIKWNETTKRFGGYQDSFETDLNNHVSKLSLQLLYNSNSTILNDEPEIIRNLPKNIELSTIESIYFLDNGEVVNNVRQFLYRDNLVFSYYPQDLNSLTDVIYKKISDNVFALLKGDHLQYIIVTGIDEFNFNNLNVSKKIKVELINLHFRLYTYNRDNKLEIKELINDLGVIVSEKRDLQNLEIIQFLKEELEYLKEEMD